MKQKEIQMELDLLLIEAKAEKKYGLDQRPKLVELLRIYIDSVVRDVPDYEERREGIVSFIQELINSCSEEKAESVLDGL